MMMIFVYRPPPLSPLLLFYENNDHRMVMADYVIEYSVLGRNESNLISRQTCTFVFHLHLVSTDYVAWKKERECNVRIKSSTYLYRTQDAC